MSSRSRRSRVLGLAAVAAVVGLITACEPAPPSLTIEYATTTAGKLTPDGTDTYAFSSTAHGMKIRGAATNKAGNLRMVGYKKKWPAAVDQQSCVTWSSGRDGNAQPGVALRINAAPNRVRAIILTNNIIYGARWGFNVHLGDSAAPQQLIQAGSFWVDWANSPLPWTICGKVEGRTLTAKAWPSVVAEPAWGDPAYGVVIQLPAAWVYSGRPGFYAGHLAPNQELVYSAISGVTLVPGTTTTTTSTTSTTTSTTSTTAPTTTTTAAPTTTSSTTEAPTTTTTEAPAEPASPLVLVSG